MIDEDRFINSKELSQLMGCSVEAAREIMHRKDFPMVRIGREMKVQRRALAEWASTRRE